MMPRLGARAVRTPSGEEWRVGRRWIGRRMPRWRRVKMGAIHEEEAANVLSIPDFGGIDDLGAAILILAAVVVVAIVVVPLLLFGIELIVLGLLVAVGVVGRTLLGRPWVVQAVPAADGTDPLTWRVVGWRRSGRLIEEVATSLEAGFDPAPAQATELLPAT